jgi:hypothetical protein
VEPAFTGKRAFAKTAAINRLHEYYSPDQTLSIGLQQARCGILDHALHNHDLHERDWNRGRMRGRRDTFASSSRQNYAALNDGAAHQVGSLVEISPLVRA